MTTATPRQRRSMNVIWELKQTTTTTATRTSPNKRFNEENNTWQVRYKSLHISLPSSAKQERETTKFQVET